MKKIVSLVLFFSLLMTMSISAFAESSVTDDNSNNLEYKVLTKSQYIARLSEVEKITIKEATKIANGNNKTNGAFSADSLPSGQYYAEYYITENAGAGFTVEVGALCVVASGCGHSNFVRVDSSWSKASGSGSYTWDSFYVKAEKSSDNTTLTLMSRGNLEVAISTSVSTTLTAKLVAADFSVSGTIGTNVYYRKTISVSGKKVLG